MERVGSEEVCFIEDKIIEYLAMKAKPVSLQEQLTCFVCNRHSQENKHNIKVCFETVEVILQDDGSLRYVQGRGKLLNTCVRGGHLHQTYDGMIRCVENGNGRVVVVKGFEELEKEGATPCPKCGDIFPTHPPEQCPNHPYLMAGDEGFKAAYDAQAAEVLDQLKTVASKTTGREDENTACPACTVSETNHNWRSCLK